MRAFGIALCITLALCAGCEAVLDLKHTELAAEKGAGVGGDGDAPPMSAGGQAGDPNGVGGDATVGDAAGDGTAGGADNAGGAAANGGTAGNEQPAGTGGGGTGGASAAGGRASLGAGGHPRGGGSATGGSLSAGGSTPVGGAAGDGGSAGSPAGGRMGMAGAPAGGTAAGGNGAGGAAMAGSESSGGAAGRAGADNGGGAGTTATVFPLGAIVGFDGSCVGIAATNGGVITDSRAVQRACADDPAESWSRDTDAHLRAALLDAFLSADSHATDLGETVSVTAAASPVTVEQQWDFDGIQFKNAGGLCIDVANGDYDNAPTLQLFHCNLADNQNWTVTPFGQVEHNGYCFDIPHSVTDDGTPLQVYQCGDDSPNQKFAFEHGRITPQGSGKCIGIAGDPTVEHSTLEVESCDTSGATLGQTFRITGPVKSLSQCLDSGTSGIGGPVALMPCTGATEQVFSWLF